MFFGRSVQIVGGMAWCIQACNFAVDIDVLYQENASLGQKMWELSFFFLCFSRNEKKLLFSALWLNESFSCSHEWNVLTPSSRILFRAAISFVFFPLFNGWFDEFSSDEPKSEILIELLLWINSKNDSNLVQTTNNKTSTKFDDSIRRNKKKSKVFSLFQSDRSNFGENVEKIRVEFRPSKKHRTKFIFLSSSQSENRPKRRFRCLEKKKKRLNNPEERRRRVHSTLVEFGQVHRLLEPSQTGEEKQSDDVDSLIKNMVDEKVESKRKTNFSRFAFFRFLS